MRRIRIWDLPTRLFHWLLVLCVAGSFVSVKIGGSAMVWHGRIGLCVLGLLVFRLIWGVVGSTYARFSQFVRGPATVRDYLAGRWSGEGHNPLGALSVLALLGILLLLVVTGVFANDDIAFEGPLSALVSKEVSDRMVGIHKWLEPVILTLVFVHLGAIAFYVKRKGHDLVKPMLTGWKHSATGESARGGGRWMFVVALICALGAVYVASGVWLPAVAPANDSLPPAF